MKIAVLGWGSLIWDPRGWEDSNFGIRRRLGRGEPSFNPEMLRQQKPDIPCRNDWTSAANRASVSSVDVALLPRLGSRPAGDAATVGLRW